MKPGSFGALLQAYFLQRLIRDRNASPATVSAYRDTFRLFLRFARTRLKSPSTPFTMSDFTAPMVLAFLEHLEKDRGNGIRTRNARLAALRAFTHYASSEEPHASKRGSEPAVRERAASVHQEKRVGSRLALAAVPPIPVGFKRHHSGRVERHPSPLLELRFSHVEHGSPQVHVAPLEVEGLGHAQARAGEQADEGGYPQPIEESPSEHHRRRNR